MRLTFLGTSCMVPTKERNVSGMFLSYKGTGILFDCGEGTQRQMNITGIKRTSANIILLSHWHGDHVSGLIGLIQTMGNVEKKVKLKIYGPKETKKRMASLLNTCIFDNQVQLEIDELEPKGVERFFEADDFYLECAQLEHNVPCIGFSFIEKEKRRINKEFIRQNNVSEGPHLKRLQEGKNILFRGKKINCEDATYKVKGKKITYVADTAYCQNAINLAKEADVLISEAAYSSKLSKKARKHCHMTAKEAALLANNSGVRQLYLTHFSQRYKTPQEIEDDARDYFNNVICAEDFMKIEL